MDKNKQEALVKTTNNYVAGRAYDMEILLDWAEGFQKHTMSPEDVDHLARWSEDSMMN